MFSAVLLTTAMGLGQPVHPAHHVGMPIHHPPGIHFVTEPNFIKVKVLPGAQTGAPAECSPTVGSPPVGAPPAVVFEPNLYPVVPAPVVIAHTNWYRWPGPAYWYTNHVTPYNAVYHKPVKAPVPKKKKN